MANRSRKKRSFPARTIVSAVVAAVCLLASASPVLPAESEGKATVRFGVIPRFNPHVTYEYYQPLMDYLSRNTPYRFELRLGRTYLETIEDLRKGTTDAAYLGGATYAIARHRFGARALVKPRNAEGGTTYRCFIIVRKDSPVRTIQDLRGKSVAFGARRATTGSLIPSYMLFGSGVTPRHLKVVKNLHNHEEVAKAVLKGLYDAGAVKDVVDCDLSRLVAKTLEFLEYRITGSRIAVENRLPPLTIPVDAHKMEQVLVNLVMNAIMAMPAGGRLVFRHIVDGPFLTLIVSDTGEGIPEENLEKIFDPFFTTKRNGEGTGLGLAVCRKIIEQHGGKISVSSRPGEGTEFHIVLPLAPP